MIEKVEGVEVKYEYNCFEEDKEILEKIEKLYKFMVKEKMIEEEQDFQFICDALKFMGYSVIYENLRTNWRGTAHILFQKDDWSGINDTVYYYKTAYGSCSVCDVWRGSDFVKTMYDEARDAIKFPNIYEMLKYLLLSDFWINDSDLVEWAKKDANIIIKLANIRYKDNEKVQNQANQIKLCLKAKEENEC